MSRSKFYAALSGTQDIGYMPHKFRALCWQDLSNSYRSRIASSITKELRTKYKAQTEKIFGEMFDFYVEMPALGDYILRSSDNIRSIRKLIIDFRQKAKTQDTMIGRNLLKPIWLLAT